MVCLSRPYTLKSFKGCLSHSLYSLKKNYSLILQPLKNLRKSPLLNTFWQMLLSELIRLNYLNIRSEIWRWFFTWIIMMLAISAWYILILLLNLEK